MTESALVQSFLNGNSLGNLTYTYDADGRIVSKGGSLASVNLPGAEGPNTYTASPISRRQRRASAILSTLKRR